MGSQAKMTNYECRRLENIKRNDDMLAALKIRSKLRDLAAAHQSVQSKRSPKKKPKIETPAVLRRSLRTRGVSPDAATANGVDNDAATANGVDNDVDLGKKIKRNLQMNLKHVPDKSLLEEGPLAMKDVYRGGDGSDIKIIERILESCRDGLLNESGALLFDSNDSLVKTEVPETYKTGKKVWGSVDVEALQLKSENIAGLVPGRITNVRFFPTRDMHMIAAGNTVGDIGFWHINGKEEDGDGIHLYRPHSNLVSGIVIDPFSISKMYSSSYDGFIRLMEVERGVFDMVYNSEYCIYSMSLSPHDRRSLYFGESVGGVDKLDVRAGKSSLSCNLHERRINTIDFNSENENIMATSSTDWTACIWDLRLMNKDKTTPLTTISHKGAVHSAYFSPSGKFLATSLDDKLGLSSGANYENTCMVYHYNQTSRWFSAFQGVWGWDDSSVYIGNTKRGVDVISVAGERVVATLESNLVSAIPCRFDAHPCNVGMLACSTSGGQVYIWTRP